MSASPAAADAAAEPGDAYWSALAQGRHLFQRCAACANAWLPPRTECPRCWSPEWRWQEASGAGRVVSWVVYHTAFDKRFQDRLPYNVAVVELAEGPRLVTNLIGMPENDEDLVGRSVSLVIEADHDRFLPRYDVSGGEQA